MIRIITIAYLVFYLGLSGFSIFNDVSISLWLVVLEIFCRAGAVLCILFYNS